LESLVEGIFQELEQKEIELKIRKEMMSSVEDKFKKASVQSKGFVGGEAVREEEI
jgi:hypothetical protein